MKQMSSMLVSALVFGLRQLAQLAAGIFALLLIAAMVSLLSGCSKNPSIRQYEKKVVLKLTDLENRSNILKARIDYAGRELRVEWFKEIDDLELQKQALEAKLQELRSADTGNLEKVKMEIDRLIEGTEVVAFSPN